MIISNRYSASLPKIVIIVFGLLFATQHKEARAQSNFDDPRPTSIDIVTERSLIDLQTCITRHFYRAFAVTALPLVDGVALDIGDAGNLLGLKGKTLLTIDIHDREDGRHISARYRHPSSEAATRRRLSAAGRICFPEALVAAR